MIRPRGHGGARGDSGVWRVCFAVGALISLGVSSNPDKASAVEICRAPKNPAALAQVWHSPCPEAADGPASLTLPLPVAGAVMAFRPVTTPGRQIFSRCVSEGRSLVFGDPQDPFAPERRRAVTGAFRTEKGWRSFLATYELSTGQAAAILAGDPETGGEGALADGLDALAQLSAQGSEMEGDPVATLRELSAEVAAAKGAPGLETLKALARPATGLSAASFDALAERYSAWCFRNAKCLAKLREHASIDGEPGFLSLPSEVEWEYAARGAAGSPRFGAPLAVERAELKRYGVLGGFDRGGEAARAVIGVGRAPTPGGFYDLYGNVAELTIDYFSSEYGSGKYGGRAARGGSFLTPHDLVGSGFREEAPLHRFRRKDGAYLGPYRSPALGARFAIGAVVKTDEAFLREAREAARSEDCAVAGEDDPLGERLRGLATEVAAGVEDVALRRKIERGAEDTRRALSQRTQNLCRILASNTVELSRDLVNVWIQFYQNEALIREVGTYEDAESEYYIKLVAKFRRQQETFQILATEYLDKYADAMKSMSEHGRSCFVDGFEHARSDLRQRGPSKREIVSKKGAYTDGEAIEAAAGHAEEAGLNKGAQERWAEEFNRVGAGLVGEKPRQLSR